MSAADLFYVIVGLALLLAVVLPNLLARRAVSAPVVLLLVGMLIGVLPLDAGVLTHPLSRSALVEHLAELCVIVALMGVGLALDRPLSLRSWASWRRWGATWRLLAVAMPLSIAGVALLGWSLMGLAPAAALLLGAALAPTDPVLASDVQVEGPTPFDATQEEIDEEHEVRFALTSEAGLNDGMAFPFVYAAIALVGTGALGMLGSRGGDAPAWAGVLSWVGWYLVGKTVVGVAVGTATGWLLARMAFRAPTPSFRLAETGEPLLALAAVLLTYGLAEVAHGYGFVAVFACALAMRSAERGHDYHVHMHQTVERLERLLTLTVLLLLGSALTDSLLGSLTWQDALVGAALVFVVRPVSGLVALRVLPGRDRLGDRVLDRGEELACAWFGVRGVGSLYYLAYAEGQARFPGLDQLWATVGFTIALSVLVHGVTATPVMRRLEAATT